jgi:4-hydroxy-4-methyl-2-oxoglutarate aldolase
MIARLRGLGSATVGEAMAGRNLMSQNIRPVFTGCSVVGPATTCVVEPFDNLSMHVALHVARPGDVIVIATRLRGSTGLWGGLTTASAVARGIAGVVADGGVRDTADIAAAGFPVWAAAITPRGASKQAFGSVNEPVSCGGVIVSAGDMVIGDDDGVVVVPQELIATVVEAAESRAAKETALRLKLAGGATPFEHLGLQETLRAMGVEIQEHGAGG